MAAATGAVIARSMSGKGGYAALCNVHLLMTAQANPGVMEALKEAWMVFPDGAPVAWLQRRTGIETATRIGGPDLMMHVLDLGRAHGLQHALFGSTLRVVGNLERRLRCELPGLQLVASYAPATGQEENDEALNRLAGAGAHVIWIALGAPKQELWMLRSAPNLAPALLLGVGAAFDFHAHTKRRAPLWMQQRGIEWLHRFASEPRRLGRRYVTTNTAFIIEAAKSLWWRRP